MAGLIIITACLFIVSGCSTTKPVQGESGWDGIKLYKPIPDKELFIAADKSTIKYTEIDSKYILMSVEDYLEICALLESAVFWNKKIFFEYIKQKPP
jgi:hypothetical protein